MLLNELELIDLTVKKFTQPQLRLNNAVIMKRLEEVRKQKEATLQELGFKNADDLMSDAKFTNRLIAAGATSAELPMKWSQAKHQMVASYAKDHPFMQVLRRNPLLRPLVEARLMFKSTQEETRLNRLLEIGRKTDGWLHVPLLYYGAHPGRFSGADKINLQNLGRGSVLRECIEAPEGSMIVAADLAQIEARITACLAEQWDLIDQFANDEDVYSNFATEVYGYAVTEDTHPKERFVGKTGILSLGFQSGAQKYHDTMNNVFGVSMELGEAERIVAAYRRRYKKIVALWYTLNELIPDIANGIEKWIGPVRTQQNRIVLPNGMPLSYNNLQVGRDGWEYYNGRVFTKLYGGKCLENIVQALARIVMTTAEIRLARHGLYAALSVHDELVYVVKKDRAPLIASVVKGVMEQKVSWMPHLPVKCKAIIGFNYGECK